MSRRCLTSERLSEHLQGSQEAVQGKGQLGCRGSERATATKFLKIAWGCKPPDASTSHGGYDPHLQLGREHGWLASVYDHIVVPSGPVSGMDFGVSRQQRHVVRSTTSDVDDWSRI